MNSRVITTARRKIEFGHRTLVMGIINVTPDSFYDGGAYKSTDDAICQAMRMVDDGADMIDIGGESTRPGSLPVPIDFELDRVIPVIEGLACKVDVPISVDTTKAEVARQAILSGAEIVNDISAMNFDPLMAKTVARAKAAVVLMHMRGTPRDMQTGDLRYHDIIAEITSFFQERIIAAKTEGIADDQIILDIGLGFGKTREDNLKLLKNLAAFKSLSRPILTGVSRKSFTMSFHREPAAERFEGTAAAV
ncbi:MAG: dihydropteroate synthase, partial [Smithellaceae bacterium]|nr:dihydropteroate synthase [Smithellaceae bacterium]